MPRIASLYWCVLPSMEHKWKERLSAWLNRRRAKKKGEGVSSITWTQLLRLTTAIHHLHPPSAPRQPSHPHILVGFPARLARHSVIPRRPLPAPIENLSGILKHPLFCSSLSFLLHVFCLSHLWLEVSCPWQSSLRRGGKVSPARQTAI